MEETPRRQTKISDYLSILYKWKKLLLINILIVTTLATVYSFLLPEQFKATATITMAPESSLGIESVNSMLTQGPLSLGAKLFGMRTTSEDLILGILYSRSLLTQVIQKFKLTEYYGYENNMDKVLKAFKGDLNFDINEYGLIEVNTINEDPKISAEMANYFVQLADSINIELNIEQARNNRIFIEKRYHKNVSDLRAAEDSFYLFQKKYGIVTMPEQLEISVKAAAELEALFAQSEITAEIYKQEYGQDSPFYRSAQTHAEILRKRIQELKDKSKLSYPSNVLYPFSKLPDVAINYFRVYREVEIQAKIMEFLLPMYEQAKVEEQKNIPSLMVIDPAVPSELKDSPKKAFIILIMLSLALFIHLPWIFRMEKIYSKKLITNTFEEKEYKFYARLVKFYRLKM